MRSGPTACGPAPWPSTRPASARPTRTARNTHRCSASPVLQDFREAQIELETALALDRNNLGAINQLGWASANLGEPEACIAYGEKRLRLSPRDPGGWSSYAQLGNCHLYLNHADLSADYLIKARAAA